MNKNSFDPKLVGGLLETVSKKIGVPPEQLKKELEDGKFDRALSSMDRSQSEKLKMAMKNPKLIEKLMTTPQAKALYEKLGGGK